MNKSATLALTLAILSAPSWGCGSTSNSSTPGDMSPTETTTDAATVTFTTVYSGILVGSCVTCHSPGGVGNSAGALNMSSQTLAYTNLQGSAAGSSCKGSGLKRVVPGDAAMSLLVQKVESATPPCGTEMPDACGNSCLSAAQVQEIEDWINEGAKND
jgi:cytochrome c553